ncbi:MAG: hypothetical protein LKM32_07010 [Chiayiivirga sp.]|jgi:hypothetical protein|uniref:hypothetical protein n=1 Tax=Chiayiivirga sp. TaxID=2041042 RepID=UPI0025C13BE6|nr:hypothetical protein [Chiayiivirga sp.]MCI1710080.1 hypothetical protein [Chiayiivirga sp.]MCI1729126.1 hypothetical protein [Chiayiivirga sp.]
MKVVIRLLALARYLMLLRQSREIRRIVQGLPVTAQRAVGQLAMSEIRNAARCSQPHLYGSQVEDRYQPWGDATQQAFAKAQSRTPQLKLRGIALWLAVAFHETRDSNHANMQGIHREVLGMLGLLKGTYAANGLSATAEPAEAVHAA